MENKVIPGVLGVFVVICLVGGMLVPIIDGMGEGEPTVNPDAGWIRMNYDTSASTYTITIAPTDDGVSVTNGTDTQTGADDTIFYADSNVAVWMQDGTVNVLGQNTDGPQFFQPEDTVTITRAADSVAIDDGSTTLTFGTPAWAYVPISSGTFGFFNNGDAAPQGAGHVAAVGGGFADVYAYNDITRYAGLGLQLQTDMEDGQIIGAYWAKPAAADSLSITPLDPGSITIQPLDPSILDPEPDASIMSVPTPSYTDGDWGYNLVTEGGIQRCVIVSYSGSGGDVVVPAKVGGYDVYRLGLVQPTGNLTTSEVFVNSNLAASSTLTISEGIKQIGNYAVATANKFVSVSLPSTLEAIGVRAFENCTGITGSIIIPDGVTYIGSRAFIYSNIDMIVIPASVIDLGGSAIPAATKTAIIASDATPSYAVFQTSSTVTTVLDLSTYEYAPGSSNIPAGATVQDNIGDSVGYIGSAMSPGQSGLPSSVTGLMLAIPIVIFAACIAVGAAVYLKRE